MIHFTNYSYGYVMKLEAPWENEMKPAVSNYLHDQFGRLLLEAEMRVNVDLKETVRLYTVGVLVTHWRTEWSHEALALRYLQVAKQPRRSAHDFLSIADTALLILSLQLPKVLRRGLDPDYFVTLGRSSYHDAALREHHEALAERDILLCNAFVQTARVVYDVFTHRYHERVLEISEHLSRLAAENTTPATPRILQ